MSKWHDITLVSGDPKDLPTVVGKYLVTISDGVDKPRVRECWFDEWWCEIDRDYECVKDVIAWRKIPKAYKPGDAERAPKVTWVSEQNPPRYSGWYKTRNAIFQRRKAWYSREMNAWDIPGVYEWLWRISDNRPPQEPIASEG